MPVRISYNRKTTLQELRFYTDVVGRVMSRPMSPAHKDAIAHYAATKLPRRALNGLHTKSGQMAALAFITQTLEQPPISR